MHLYDPPQTCIARHLPHFDWAQQHPTRSIPRSERDAIFKVPIHTLWPSVTHMDDRHVSLKPLKERHHPVSPEHYLGSYAILTLKLLPFLPRTFPNALESRYCLISLIVACIRSGSKAAAIEPAHLHAPVHLLAPSDCACRVLCTRTFLGATLREGVASHHAS